MRLIDCNCLIIVSTLCLPVSSGFINILFKTNYVSTKTNQEICQT